ncbi:hypothetical protein JCM5350_007961 [Sporobolomyces pararoseus]
MSSLTAESVYAIPKFSKGETDLVQVDGPALNCSILSCDMYLSPEAKVPEPDKFEIKWEMEEPHLVGVELFRIDILPKEKTGRYVVGFKEPVVLKGNKGSVNFLKQMSTETFRLCAETKGFSSSLNFHFRPLPETASSPDATLTRLYHYSSNDVAFVFPSSSSSTLKKSSPRILWTRSSLLRSSSPYFETLLSSEGFTESKTFNAPLVSFDKAQTSTPGSITDVHKDQSTTQDLVKASSSKAPSSDAQKVSPSRDELEHEDSDLEDDLYPSETCSPAIRRIEVHGIAYKTLLSYLYYLETGTIRFSTLSSLLRNTPPFFSSKPSSDSVPSCSPKSMFLLAHLYENSTLRQLSFSAISSQLGSNNALTEYFSDLSSLYPEIKAVTLKAVLENWEIVKDSDEMRKIQEELEEGKLERNKVGLLFELFNQLKPV